MVFISILSDGMTDKEREMTTEIGKDLFSATDRDEMVRKMHRSAFTERCKREDGLLFAAERAAAGLVTVAGAVAFHANAVG